jgi:ABC-type multidrug transport system fused ATPase/permease subunit
VHTLSSDIGGLKAANFLHRSLLNNVMRLPVSTYFDVTPVGRVLARFSSDVNVIDVILPRIFHMWLPHLFRVSNLDPILPDYDYDYYYYDDDDDDDDVSK